MTAMWIGEPHERDQWHRTAMVLTLIAMVSAWAIPLCIMLSTPAGP